MTIADLWIAVPLMILAGSALAILLLGAVIPTNLWTGAGIIATVMTAAWVGQTPPLTVAPTLALASTPAARLFIAIFSLTAAAALLISHRDNSDHGINGEEYPATVLFATFGATALSMATNLLIMFLGLEAMTFGFYILVAMDLKREVSAEAGLKYLLMGAVAAAFLAFGIGLHYAGTGSLSLTNALQLAAGNKVAHVGWGFILVGIAFKLSLVPAHLWTPDIYQGAPAPVTAFLSALSKGATVALLLLILPTGDLGAIRPILWWLALLSMVVGNLAALLQTKVRRMLGYSSVAQMGYVALALLSGTAGGYRAAVYYAVAYSVMSLAAFGAIAVIERNGSGEDTEGWRGLGRRSPFAAGTLSLALFALAGVPPTAGFTGKFLIFTAAIKAGEVPLAIIGILTAAVSAYYYLAVVVSLYMHDPGDSAAQSPSPAESVALIATGAAILIIGTFPSPLLRLLAAAFP
ncbi:NADH-quinone oxidoreductase subunit N [Geobacter pelophilus]|uniref:NADH-quinone oxidoreductase subunit N n=1 Tax=Geoanaerobacter pelophilus TaxID=60036 RepID=A0AAW4L0W1_9BACT|nr:NADH-quinone oxidoreductase subunit N [Geoanaerobacter pelophilus]MBT0664699.1 NADH-quinone oxidoreductase subunit N [Geoanaerobacter pelophilus]